MAKTYVNYLNLIEGQSTKEVLIKQHGEMLALVHSVDEVQLAFFYEENKWSVAGVIIHIMDCERIMAYRALCFSRGEIAELPGFDEDNYAALSEASHKSKKQILSEFDAVRLSTISLYTGMSPIQLRRRGNAGGIERSVEEFFRVILGHCAHHRLILRERYGI